MLEYPWQTAPSGAVFSKAMTSRSGGRSVTGSQQVVASSNGFWRAQIEAPVYEEGRTLAWRAFYASVDGMATPFLVPAFNKYRPRDSYGRMLNIATAAGLGTGALWDHSGFGQTEPELITVTAGAPMNATRLTLNHPNVEGLRPGHYFGIRDRLYIVSRAWSLDYERIVTSGGELALGGEILTLGGEALTLGFTSSVLTGENVQVVEFWPWLREPVIPGEPLLLGRPVCKMRFASDDTGVLDQGLGLSGTVQLDLEEAN